MDRTEYEPYLPVVGVQSEATKDVIQCRTCVVALLATWLQSIRSYQHVDARVSLSNFVKSRSRSTANDSTVPQGSKLVGAQACRYAHAARISNYG